MMNESYYIEKALRRAKATPHLGGDILLLCFREMKERVLEEATQTITDLKAEVERLKGAAAPSPEPV